MPRLCIALICHSDAPWTPYYARFLAERGHTVHVLSFHPRPLDAGHFHYVGAEEADGRLPKGIYLRSALRVRRLLRSLRPDVVLAAYFRSNGLVGALTKCAPLVVSTRGIDADYALPFGLGRFVTRFVARRADFLHASSAELLEILHRIGIPDRPSAVFPLGTDAAVFHPRSGPRTEGPLRIVCTRKHEPVYDNDTVVRALARLRERGVDFEARFVGTGSRLEATRSLVASLGLDASVALTGAVEHDAIPDQLRWADVYVSAALADGASSSLFEAMSCRLYPVVTDVRANRDWIRHGHNGFLFEAGNDARCAEGLELAGRQLTGLGDVLDANRALVVERLDRSRNLGRLEEILVAVAAGRGNEVADPPAL